MIPHLIRPVNAFMAGYSYLLSSITGRAMIISMPLSISIELTNHCNLHCPECVSGSGIMKRETGYMSVELYSRVIEELSPYLYNINLYFQGESMLHPSFFSFIRKEIKADTVLSTNGHFLTKESSEKIARSGLSKIIISLDGMEQDIYSQYRKNGQLKTVLEGIRNIADAKSLYSSSLKIEIQLLVNRLNEHQIPMIRQFAKKMKVNFRLKSMQIINQGNHELWLPTKEKFRRYALVNGKYINKNSFPNRCARLWFNPVITWDGKVIPCCFDKNAEHIMGDLNIDSFREIWHSPKYSVFRRMIFSDRYLTEICRNCTSGLRGVKY